MATRTIANAGGNWSATGTWVEGVVPTSADNVVATATSGNLTIDAAAACRSIDLTGYVGTATHNSGITLSIGDGTAPPSGVALHFPGSGWTYTAVNTTSSVLALVGSSGTTKTVNFGGKTLGRLTVDTSAGTTHQLITSNVTVGSGGIEILNAATLDTNGRTVTTSDVTQLSASASLILGASTINCSNRWNTPSGSVSGASATIAHTGTDIDTASGQTYGTVTWSASFTSDRGINRSGGSGTFTVAALTVTSTNISGLRLGAAVTVTGLLTITGGSARISVEGNTNGTRITLSAATVSLSNVDFQDIAGSGAATWSGTSVGDGGNNTGITFTSPVTRYWVGGTGTWDTSTTHWSATSGGSSGASVPGVQDTAVFDANSFTGAGQTLTFSSTAWVRHGSVDFSAVTNSPTIAFGSGSRSFYGSVALPPIANATLSGTSKLTFEGRSSANTITSGGRDWGTFATATGATTIDCGGGTYTLADDFASSLASVTAITLTSGTFNSNGYAVNLSAGGFASTGSGTRTLTMGSSTWTIGGSGSVWNVGAFTLNAGTSLIQLTNTGGSSKTFGGTHTYYDVTITGGGAGVIIFNNPNTFHNLTIGAPKSVRFQSSQTQTITGALFATGTAGNLVTVTSSTAGTAATLSKASGIVALDYVSLKDSTATGGASWYAGSHSTNVSGNSGWSFTDYTPAFIAGAASIPGPALSVVITPALITCAATFAAPIVSGGGSPGPAVVSTVATAAAAVVSTGTVAAPAVVTAPVTMGAPVVSSGAAPMPVVIASTTTVPTATETAGAGLAPTPVVSTVAVAAPTLSVGGTTSPGVATLTATLPAPAVGAVSAANPALVAATALVYDPATSWGATADPQVIYSGATFAVSTPSVGVTLAAAAINCVAAVADAGVSAQAGLTVQADSLGVAVSVGVPVATGGAELAPTSISARTSSPSALVSGGGLAGPDSLAAAASFPPTQAQVAAAVAPMPLALATVTLAALVSAGAQVAATALLATVAMSPPLAVRRTWPTPPGGGGTTSPTPPGGSGITSPQVGVTVPV